jgi:hypothetical protein
MLQPLMNTTKLKKYSLSTSPGIHEMKNIGNELSAGMYIYSLVVNNSIIDSKQMILSK